MMDDNVGEFIIDCTQMTLIIVCNLAMYVKGLLFASLLKRSFFKKNGFIIKVPKEY